MADDEEESYARGFRLLALRELGEAVASAIGFYVAGIATIAMTGTSSTIFYVTYPGVASHRTLEVDNALADQIDSNADAVETRLHFEFMKLRHRMLHRGAQPLPN